MYCGDMDTKDIPIRMILCGMDEIKNWSHYQAAEQTHFFSRVRITRNGFNRIMRGGFAHR